jgi:hypothetical protein
MVFPLLVVLGFVTQPPTMIRLFAELFKTLPFFHHPHQNQAA